MPGCGCWNRLRFRRIGNDSRFLGFPRFRTANRDLVPSGLGPVGTNPRSPSENALGTRERATGCGHARKRAVSGCARRADRVRREVPAEDGRGRTALREKKPRPAIGTRSSAGSTPRRNTPSALPCISTSRSVPTGGACRPRMRSDLCRRRVCAPCFRSRPAGRCPASVNQMRDFRWNPGGIAAISSEDVGRFERTDRFGAGAPATVETAAAHGPGRERGVGGWLGRGGAPLDSSRSGAMPVRVGSGLR